MGFFKFFKDYFLRLLTLSLNAFPAENLTVLEAAILIASPVLGLRPTRAARFPELNVPKPINCTLSPLVTAFLIVSKAAFNACSALALDNSDSPAIAATSSALFKLCSLMMFNRKDVMFNCVKLTLQSF